MIGWIITPVLRLFGLFSPGGTVCGRVAAGPLVSGSPAAGLRTSGRVAAGLIVGGSPATVARVSGVVGCRLGVSGSVSAGGCCEC